MKSQKKNSKSLPAIAIVAISAGGVLLVALALVLVLAYIEKWDILSWFTSEWAEAVYGILAIVATLVIGWLLWRKFRR